MYKLSDILERSNLNANGVNSYTSPNINNFTNFYNFTILNNIPNGIKEVADLYKYSTDANTNDIDALLTPPSEVYTDIIPPEGESIASQVDNLVSKQFVQQFYEAYMVPIGAKEVYNRLGTIAGNISDLHSLYPSGVKGLIAKDSLGSWRTNLNFSFRINEGLGGSTKPAKYSSLAFPPFISHDTLNANDLISNINVADNEEDFEKDKSFDMQNILYKRNEATYRLPAFKQINDNIHLLQVFLNRCFGIESTFINEWDLSMYMQEGLMSFIEKADINGDPIRIPQFVTTLSYGLLDDAPIEALQKQNKNSKILDIPLETASTFASLNLAVSTRYGIDDQAIGQQANKTIYTISKYPYSTYWYPNDSGNNLEEFNMSNYIKTMFSYDINGLPFDERSQNNRDYTPAIFHGEELSKSTKTFTQILNYSDNRNAILSGWNATDENGKKYLDDDTNNSLNSNAFSYLPYWKQFYTSPDDGMTEIDLYMQEIAASGKETSFINASYQIIGMMSSSNDTFNNLCEEANKNYYDLSVPEGDEDTISDDFNKVSPDKYGLNLNYSDFKILGVRLKGSKMLKMFLDKDKITKRAQNLAKKAEDDVSNIDDISATSTSSINTGSSILKSATPIKILGDSKKIKLENGQNVEVTEYTVDDKDELCSKKTVEDGIAEYSPFLYGGPHGKYFSPLTLEGYTQFNNRNLANVPTVDPYNVFNNILNKDGIRSVELSKNYKLDGTYIDTVIALTPNEREALVNGSSEFGVKDMKPDTDHWVSYTSNQYYREYFHDWKKRIRIKIFRRKFYIQNPFYYKISRITNGRQERRLRYSYDYGTGVYSTRSHTTAKRSNVSVQTDWINTDFKLLPTCGWRTDFNVNNSDCGWTVNQTINHIKHDENTFNRETGDRGYVAAKDKISSSCVKWMIVPDNVSGGPVCGTKNNKFAHFSAYNAVGTPWYNQLKKLYTAGTREMSVTLPIKDSGNNILELVCGVANIYKSSAITYIYIPKLIWHWRFLFKRSKKIWKITYNRRRRPKWRISWYWLYKFYRIFCPHIIFILKKIDIDTYNMYFRPNKVQWILPTNSLLSGEASSVKYSERDLSSTNIIKRYSVEGTTFEHISNSNKSKDRYSPDLFPFSLGFINKYGKYEPNTQLPGVSSHHSRPTGSLKVLHTKGFYYGNILDSYKAKGFVQSTVSVKTSYEKWKGNVIYADTASGSRFFTRVKFGKLTVDINPVVSGILNTFFGRLYEKKSVFSVEREVNWTADTPSYEASRFIKQTELTKILDTCQTFKSIQEYQITNKKKYMSWYDPTDTISVYIDTVTQQIAWLKQLKDYANIYLTDQLIYEVYQKSVDNNIKNIIEYNYKGDVKIVDSEAFSYQDLGGWTNSFTEDINYSDALAIVRRVFNTSDPNKNTIYELTSRRLESLEALLKKAKELKTSFFKTPTTSMHTFMRLVTNTKSFLDGAIMNGTNVEDVIFDSNGNYIDTLFAVDNNVVYNILKNPAAVLWAYINVLYQVRKYWVNVRLNKRSGSYWQLRGLERVLTFLLAQNQAESGGSPYSTKPPISTGEPELKAKQIMYVQPRTSFNNQIQANSINVINTQAVYLKVEYLNTPEPQKSSKWNNETQTYDGSEIVYVKEVYKYARKPVDNLYYVMSTAITNNINNYSKLLKDVLTQISSKSYTILVDDYNQTIDLIKKGNILNLEEISTLETIISPINKTIEETLSYIKTLTDYNIATLRNIFTTFVNNLALYKRNYYMNEIKNCLYTIYIKWQPQQVWTGLREDDKTGAWHIDDWQKKDTAGKERSVKDLYGYYHTSTEAISAGITFDVVAGLDTNILLSSPNALRNSSLLEVLCSCVDKIDLWRVEIPEALSIPASLLSDKPILVPAYQIDTALNGLKTGEVTKSAKSVLAGIATNNVSPILETNEGMLTINTLSALGKFSDVSTTGLNIADLQNSGN